MERNKTSSEDGDCNIGSNQSAVHSDPSTPSQKSANPSKIQRSITPRGHIFTSLNDAHRNITSRTNGTSIPPRKTSDHDGFSDHHDGSEQSQNNLDTQQKGPDSVISPSNVGQPIVDPKQHLPNDANTFQLPKSEAGRSLTSPRSPPSTMPLKAKPSGTGVTSRVKDFEREESRGDHATTQVRCQLIPVGPSGHKAANTMSQPEDASTSTVEKILDEYAAEEDQDRSSSPTADFANTFGGAKLARAGSPSEPPQSNLPSFPRLEAQLIPPTGPGEGSSSRPDSSVIDSQDLLEADAELAHNQKSLEPAPLRILTRPERVSSGFFNDAESSTNGEYDTSTEDPFKYDSEQYREILRPTKERDVSQALKRISRLDQASDATFFTPNGSPQGKAGGNEMPTAFNRQESRGAAPAFWHERPYHHYPNSRSIQPAAVEREPGEIKVVIQHAPNVEQIEHQQQSKTAGLANQHLNVHGEGDNGFLRDTTNGSDWVTEATSDVGTSADIASDHPFPILGFKKAGSSIADYSDYEGDVGNRIGPFESQEHILQHPGNELQPASWGLRNLRDNKQQVLLPKVTGREGIGFPQNSLRLFSVKSKDTDNTVPRPGVIRQLSNPFRQGNYRRADSNSNFQFQPRGAKPSRYEFRDSASEYTVALDTNKTTCGTFASPSKSEREENGGGITVGLTIDSTSRGNRNATDAWPKVSLFSRTTLRPDAQMIQMKIGHQTGLEDETPPSGYRSRRPRDLKLDTNFAMDTRYTMDNEPSSTTSFDFELLPLGEAQARLKRQRESGETDETEPAESRNVRFKRAQSAASSQAWSIPSPIPVPTAAHLPNNVAQEPPTHRRATQPDDVMSPVSVGSFRVGYALRSPATPGTDYGPFSPVSPGNSWWRSSIVSPQTPKRLLPDDRTEENNAVQPFHRPMNSDSLPSYKARDSRISPEAKFRSKCWFYAAVALSILPFIAVIIIVGVADDSLAWVTGGEVRRLTYGQRRVIKIMFYTEMVACVAVLAGIITWVAIVHRGSN